MEKIKEYWKQVLVLVVLVLIVWVLFFRGVGNKSNQSEQVESDVELTQIEMDYRDTLDEIARECKISLQVGQVVLDNCLVIDTNQEIPLMEEVGYLYIRALSNLDLETAFKYSYKTKILSKYQSFFEKDTEFNYKLNFDRNLYKQALLSLTIQGVQDTVTLSPKQAAMTFNIEALDLTNKDFWVKDKEVIFNTLAKYRITESDTTKAREYLYNYILNYYSSPEAKKIQKSVTFKIEKVYRTNYWVITDDLSLDAVLSNHEGESIITYIMNQFEATR